MATITSSDRIMIALASSSNGEGPPDWGDAPMELYLAIRNAFPDTWPGFMDHVKGIDKAYGEWTLQELNDPECDGPGKG